jgi:hypothetical protein
VRRILGLNKAFQKPCDLRSCDEAFSGIFFLDCACVVCVCFVYAYVHTYVVFVFVCVCTYVCVCVCVCKHTCSLSTSLEVIEVRKQCVQDHTSTRRARKGAGGRQGVGKLPQVCEDIA